MQKADSNSSAGTGDDSSTKDENLQSSSHDTKPNVSGSPLLSDKESVYSKIDLSTINIQDEILRQKSILLSTGRNMKLRTCPAGILKNVMDAARTNLDYLQSISRP